MIPISHYTYNIMKEEWIEIQHKTHKPNSIVAVSNTGKVKRYDGTVTETTRRMSMIRYNGKQLRLHRLIAMLFIPKTEEDIKIGRNIVDHITHNPVGMNINDVRNLRWCTNKENSNFEEALLNMKIAQNNRSTEWCKHISEGRKGIEPWNKGMKHTDFIQNSKNKTNNLSVQEE